MRLIDLTGEKFGRLVVIERAENQGKQTKWLCKCDCGNTVAVMGSRLRGNITHSCGCIQKEVTRNRSFKHGGSTSKLRSVWAKMISRCYRKGDKEYPRYGERGIKVCEEWKEYGNFYKWAISAGYDEDAKRGVCTLDRIDNNGNYSPENCRFTTMKRQSNNRRDNQILEFDGEMHTVSEWAEIKGIKIGTLWKRVNKLGWSIEQALTEPRHKNQYG